MMSLEDELMNFRDVEYKGCSIKESESIPSVLFQVSGHSPFIQNGSCCRIFYRPGGNTEGQDLSEEEKMR